MNETATESPVINETPSTPVIPSPSPVNPEKTTEPKYDWNYFSSLVAVESSMLERRKAINKELEEHYALMAKVGKALIAENPAMKLMISRILGSRAENGKSGKGRPKGSPNVKK